MSFQRMRTVFIAALVVTGVSLAGVILSITLSPATVDTNTTDTGFQAMKYDLSPATNVWTHLGAVAVNVGWVATLVAIVAGVWAWRLLKA